MSSAGNLMEIVQIQLTAGSVPEADRLIETLLDDQLVACAQRSSPVISRYWWDGRIEESEESVVLLKTTAALKDVVVQRVIDMHEDEVPEVLVFPVEDGNEAYIDWVNNTVQDRL